MTAFRTLDQRLNEIYERLMASILNDKGYGGPLRHAATVDNWFLHMNTSDFGDLFFTARGLPDTDKEDKFYGFECGGPDRIWQPFIVGTGREDLEWLVPLAEKAEWKDTIERTKDAPEG